MLYNEICAAVDKLRRKYGERDPFLLCEDMGILLRFDSLGMGENAIKGFFAEFCRVPSITVNSDLPDVLQKIIAAHELGHAVLHRKGNMRTFRDLGLFDETSEMEKEANLFAAELLIDDDEVLEHLQTDGNFFYAAARLRVPPELLDYKFRLMNSKGKKLNIPPITARSNFLKYIEAPDNAYHQ